MRPAGPTCFDRRAKESEPVKISCSFCSGKGKDPFGIMSYLSICSVWGGQGKVRLMNPFRTCAHCRGTGAIKTFTCTTCGGKGFAHLSSSSLTACPHCQGTGDDASAPAMACLDCRGRGWVPGHDRGGREGINQHH